MEEERGIKVYIRVNENNEVVEINSEIFITDFTGWILIDEGFGDKYAHAQGNYLGENLTDDDGNYKFIYKNGKLSKK